MKKFDHNESGKNVIQELSSTEEDIIKLGNNITTLLELIKNTLEGDYNYSQNIQNLLKEILSLIEKIRKNMHELVDKVYSKKNFAYFSQLSKDLNEKDKELKKILLSYFSSNNFFSNRQIQSRNIQRDEPTFSTSSTSVNKMTK